MIRYIGRNIFMIILILGTVIYISLNQVHTLPKHTNYNQLENSIIEPKLYAKLGTVDIEISAKSATNEENKVILNEISATIYQKDHNILANLKTQIGIFDMQTKILMINQGLSVQNEKFHIESASCAIKINDHSIVFYKPTIEIL